MKKTYIAPAVTEMTVVTEAMVAASIQIIGGSGNVVDTKNDGVQLGNTQRGEWGNLWTYFLSLYKPKIPPLQKGGIFGFNIFGSRTPQSLRDSGGSLLAQ